MSSFIVSQNSYQTSGYGNLAATALTSTDPHDEKYIPQAPLDEELIRSSMPIPAFLPYFDIQQNVGETAEMRWAYRQMLSDPNVKAAFISKMFAAMSQDVSITPYRNGKKIDRRAARFIEWNLTDGVEGGLPALIWEVLFGGLMAGYSISEKVTEVEQEGEWRGKRILTKLKSKDVDQDLVPIIDAYGNITGIKGLRYNAGETWNPADFLVFKHLGIYGNPLGMSDFRAAYGRYWMLDAAIKIRGMAAQKRALPVIWAEYPDSTKQSNVENILDKLRYRNWIAVPMGVRLNVLDVAGQSESFFSSFVRDLREEIFLGITLASLQQMQGGAGTMRGASKVHDDSADLAKWYLSYAFANCLNDRKQGIIRWLCRLNFNGLEGYPKAAFRGLDEAEIQKMLGNDMLMSQMGWKFNTEQMEERTGRKFEKNPELAMIDPQMQQQQQMGAGGPMDQQAPGMDQQPPMDGQPMPQEMMQ